MSDICEVMEFSRVIIFLHLCQILPSIANAHPAVRNMAVVCLGTCTLHSKELAKTHMVLLLQVICTRVLST